MHMTDKSINLAVSLSLTLAINECKDEEMETQFNLSR